LLIHQLKPGEIEECASFWHSVWHATFPEIIHPHPLSRWRKRLRAFHRKARVVVAKRNRRICAVMIYFPNGFIDQLWIDPACQGQGLGTKLIQYAERKTGQPAHLYCWVINRPALEFYKRKGFVICGRKKHPYFPSNLYVMKKRRDDNDGKK
jgi:ribosomal protein S18 acetylase RimI-like enzyme